MTNQLPYSISYENSRGELLRLDSPPFVAVESEIFDSGWSFSISSRPNSEGGRLISRRRRSGEKQLVLSAFAADAAALSDALGQLSAVTEFDLCALSPGRLWVNGLYLSCYIVGSQKSLSPDFPNIAKIKLSVLPELPAWCSETTFSTQSGEADGHSYPYAYPRRYSSGMGRLSVLNDSGGPCPMRIVFNGPAQSPRILINGQPIGVEISAAEGERVIVDQLQRRIYKLSLQGAQQNCFGSRLRNGRCFEYLPAGQSTIEYAGCSTDITIINMRSEPPWSS